jgi:hypothetical protein
MEKNIEATEKKEVKLLNLDRDNSRTMTLKMPQDYGNYTLIDAKINNHFSSFINMQIDRENKQLYFSVNSFTTPKVQGNIST